jgi:glycosyltransferase involved in cell wall biosynthesis
MSGSVLCLIWRPAGDVVRDGGLVRTYEILQSLPEGVVFTVVDRFPSPIRGSRRLRIVEYRIPRWTETLRSGKLPLAGLIEVLVTLSIMVASGARELQRTNTATVYVPTSEVPWVTFAGVGLAWIFGKRLVLTNHNTRLVHARAVFGMVGRFLWHVHARADCVIAVSSAIAEELGAMGIRRNVQRSSNGFTRSNHPNNRVMPKQSAIYIGRLELGKGIYDLIDVWRLVHAEVPGASLRLVGHSTSSARAKFVTRSESLGLDSAIDLLGVVSDERKWQLLSESCVCLFLSHIEGWGFVPIEALSLGVPVVLYDLPCYRESLHGLIGVYRVSTGDVAAAASQVIELLSLDKVEYMKLSHSIKIKFDYPNWSQIASKELSLILGRDAPEAVRYSRDAET